MEFVERIKAKAAEEIKTIVLPEAAEERNIKAANQIIKEGFAKLVLIGNPDQIHHLASEYYLDEIGKATIVAPENNPKRGVRRIDAEAACQQRTDPRTG